jgi:hypothetical protein
LRPGDQVIAAGVDSGAQRAGDDLQVGDLRLDLGQLGSGACLQPDVPAPAMPVLADVEKVSDLIEGKPEPLRCLDHLQHSDRLLGVEPMPPRLRSGSASNPRRS